MSQLLGDAGWTEGRRVDSRSAVELLLAEGHLLPEWGPGAISEFEGLTIEFLRNDRADQIVMAAGEAARRWYPADVASYQARAGTALLPCGYTYHEHLLLLVDDAGRWYGGHGDDLWLIGPTAASAVDQIASGPPFQSLD